MNANSQSATTGWRFSVLAIVASVLAGGASPSRAADPTPNRGATKVEIRKDAGRFQLYVDQQPFYIKGAGIELGSVEKLKQHGGNSFRTWSTDNGRDSGEQGLDRALSNGLDVAMGLDVDHERRGFDYDNTNVFRRLDRAQFEVCLYVHHSDSNPVEELARRHVDQFTVLPESINQSAARIRSHDLDILFFGNNLTASYGPGVVLASHRLARIQMIHFCNPVTTGMRYMDRFLVGSLIAGESGPESEFAEKTLSH